MKANCPTIMHAALNNEQLFALATMLDPWYKGRLFPAIGGPSIANIAIQQIVIFDRLSYCDYWRSTFTI